MCGIVGAAFSRPVVETDVHNVRAGMRALAHRGPDDDGVEVVKAANTVLGFRRLSIIDLATGDQPMSVDSSHHILFNGEVYNYRELRAELVHQGVPFRSRSDTEVLLWLLARNGIAALDKVVGMFGFAYLDAGSRRLILGRDRLGVKQVYYSHDEDGFYFASEPKALLPLQKRRPSLDETQLEKYFAFRCVPAPHTLFDGIKKLPPGCVLVLDLNSWNIEIVRYWQPPSAETRTHRTLRQAVDEIETRFLKAVERRLVSDVPVGAFLSGGLDSSLVVAAMHRLGHADLRTFSAVFPGDRDDEGPFARRVATRFKTRHFEHHAEAARFAELLPQWITLNDDLVADASCLPLLAVSRLARENGCKVLLSGEGADELFAGYGSYHKYVLLHRAGRLVPSRATRAALVRLIARFGLLRGQDRSRVQAYLVDQVPFMGTAALLDPAELTSLLTIPTSGRLPSPSGNALSQLCAFDFVTRIPDDLMVRTDRATMGASVEARVPFLDHQLVELIFGLPDGVRARPGVSKVALRLLAGRWGVPIQTITHRKIGFQLPIGQWFRGELKPLWERILSERAVSGIAYERVAKIYDAHLSCRGDFEELLWRIAALELWYRRWIAGDSSMLGTSDGVASGRDVVAV